MQPANTLILDEPTNHLDPSSRQVLQDAVSKFEGAVVVASHDLPFVTAIATEAYRLEGGRLHEEKEFVKPASQNGKHGKKK
jgi:ATP-binding cassette subfamily F protein 3